MGHSLLFRVYSQLPVWVQNLACSAAGIQMRRTRYGKTFHEFLAFLEQSQWQSLQEQQEYQNEQLRRVVRYAYATVPYYREIMDQRKLVPSDIVTTADLVKLPMLTKQIVRQRTGDLISRAIPRSQMIHGHTGGTTGTSIQLYADSATNARQWAVWWRHRRRFGLQLSDEFIVFAGRDVIPIRTMGPPCWRRNWPMHQTYVSIHHMTQPNMPALVEYLCSRRVKYYSGYPSAVYLLAQYLLAHNIRLPHPPELIVLGAETLLPHQRRTMQQAFGCTVTDQYGASEQCGNISDCEKHCYHVDMEFGVVEFLPLDGLPSHVRRIVCTGFWNSAMPLIRYDIGDIATLPQSPRKCICGRQSPIVEKIDGRIESYIITPDGRQAGRLDFIFKDTRRIREAQLVQTEVESVTVKVVREADYGSADERELLEGLRTYLGDVIRLNIEYVDDIPREPNGKFRQIVSSSFRDRVAIANKED